MVCKHIVINFTLSNFICSGGKCCYITFHQHCGYPWTANLLLLLINMSSVSITVKCAVNLESYKGSDYLCRMLWSYNLKIPCMLHRKLIILVIPCLFTQYGKKQWMVRIGYHIT